ncbi:hypothetical protein [uncultured Methanobrevibacter sp.]|uniref:hypothetical protein n=1 Tax=uncultured Methanobrevibacter sp. TaxID=253161 RepID=UPI00260DD0D2|nr:hypothetical protein [uncultured Methanobrevibacter sp.]
MKSCKYMRSETNYTPNNYDITFKYEDIPSNIDTYPLEELLKQLNQVNPLTKKLHVNLNVDNEEFNDNYLLVHTKLEYQQDDGETVEVAFK